MVTFGELCKIDNGARFHNADLHIHSFGASHDVKDALMTPEAIVDSAVNQGLSLIAITDHNSDANVQRALDRAKQYNGRILVVAGVEVTTANGHLLAYFAPDRADQLSKFISRLNLVGKPGDDNTRTAKSMADAIAEAYQLDGICIAAHIDRDKTGFDAFAPGFQNWKKDIVTSPGLYGLECDALKTLIWYSELDDLSPEGLERKKMFAGRKLIEDLASRHHLAHLQGSDSHSMKQFENSEPAKKWTRIKLAELSFDAFRVALVDPTARVRACGSLSGRVPRIRGVSITGGFLHNEAIHFSDNLNCFIGGRGTGKSTAIRAIAYAFGINDDFETYENCPDSVCVYCEDGNGILYRYERAKGGDVSVRAKEDASVLDVPSDSFRIEYFGQGELAHVAKDPLNTPELFQAFLDRHTNLRDLLETEQLLVAGLRENAGRLNPLENSFAQLKAKRETLAEIEKKLKVAEDGKLRDVVAIQSKLASEKAIRESIEALSAEYINGYTFANMQRDFAQIQNTAGTCTEDSVSKKTIAEIGALFVTNNTAVHAKQVELNALLKQTAKELTRLAGELKASHQRMSAEAATKLAELKAQGVVTDIVGLETLLRTKTSIAKEIAAVEQRSSERTQCVEQRDKLRADLDVVREKMTQRRKLQLKTINENLALTISDYTVFVKYDDAGITTEFEQFLQGKMHGTYLPDDLIRHICNRTTPSDLADLVLARDDVTIATTAKISKEWANKIIEKLCYWNILFDLQALAKPPKPVITVRTKASPAKEIPVVQLSDGQRHTILLTIAMLADSNVPLVIDQPEDDLDNAFIYTSIVATLRSIKEKRQVILVTHNANIAVLGDSELILPMRRQNGFGKSVDRGSIDSQATKNCVVNTLEGGETAFLRRKEIYNY